MSFRQQPLYLAGGANAYPPPRDTPTVCQDFPINNSLMSHRYEEV